MKNSNRFSLILSTLTMAILLVACGSDKKKVPAANKDAKGKVLAQAGTKSSEPAKPGEDENLVSYNVANWKLDSTKLDLMSSDAQALWKKLSAGEKVDFRSITHLMLDRDVTAYNQIPGKSVDTKMMEAALQVWSHEMPVQNAELDNPHNYKRLMETLQSGQFQLTPPVYNTEAVTLAHLAKENRLQCYSGTNWFLATMRNIESASKYRQRNYVVILEQGHVLPGYMKKASDGSWELYGVEMTRTGRAEVQFGKVADLKDQSLRIVDAESYVVADLFKDALEEPAAVVAAIVSETDSRYEGQIPVDEMEKSISAIEFSRVELNESRDEKLNRSPFGFGVSNVPVGDRTRDALEVATNFRDVAPPVRAYIRTDSVQRFIGEPPAVSTDPLIEFKVQTGTRIVSQNYRSLDSQLQVQLEALIGEANVEALNKIEPWQWVEALEASSRQYPELSIKMDHLDQGSVLAEFSPSLGGLSSGPISWTSFVKVYRFGPALQIDFRSLHLAILSLPAEQQKNLADFNLMHINLVEENSRTEIYDYWKPTTEPGNSFDRLKTLDKVDFYYAADLNSVAIVDRSTPEHRVFVRGLPLDSLKYKSDSRPISEVTNVSNGKVVVTAPTNAGPGYVVDLSRVVIE